MSDFMKKEWEQWEKHVECAEEWLKKVDGHLQEDFADRSRRRMETMKEFVDPSVLEERCNELKKLESSLRNLVCNQTSIQLKILKPLLQPGQFLYVESKNQKAVSQFCPYAYETIMKTTGAVDGLKILASAVSITEKMNDDVFKMTQETRRMNDRLLQIRKERRGLDKALHGEVPVGGSGNE